MKREIYPKRDCENHRSSRSILGCTPVPFFDLGVNYVLLFRFVHFNC